MSGDAAGLLARQAGAGEAGLGLSLRITAAVRERVVGQDAAVEALLIALLTGGHVLLEGLPGLAKTLMVRALANAIDTGFSRIQFTPDLLPSDIAGTPILDPRTGEFRVRKGPVFSNIVLADEINRAPPKVQAALLEAMEERQVSIAGDTFRLADPFMVLATQNPVELHGTYPLAEAQLDRFAMKLDIGYPSRGEEKEIVRWAGDRAGTPLEPVATVEEVFRARGHVAAVHVEEAVLDYIVELAFATREPAGYGLEELESLIDFGTSPRASIFLARTARARAWLCGRSYVLPDDVKAMAPMVLPHRLRTTYEADARGIGATEVVRRVLEAVPSP